jgi:hypothetical protein
VQRLRADGLQAYCRECAWTFRQTYAQTHRENYATNQRRYVAAHLEQVLWSNRHRSRSESWQVRQDMIAAYGGACTCCGEVEPYFLELDHWLQDGAAERKSLGIDGGVRFYRYIQEQGYPPSYRLLCANCNAAYGFYHFCPHVDTDPLARRSQYPSPRSRHPKLWLAVHRWRLKIRVLTYYGSVCACCLEPTPYFLQIDHIHNNGSEERRRLKLHGWNFYAYLETHHFPKGYRVLCANCNRAYGAWKFCPHVGTGYQISLDLHSSPPGTGRGTTAV